MKKLMILSAIVSILTLGSCGNYEDEVTVNKTSIDSPGAPRQSGLSEGEGDSGPASPRRMKQD